jgi:hypothetical protein
MLCCAVLCCAGELELQAQVQSLQAEVENLKHELQQQREAVAVATAAAARAAQEAESRQARHRCVTGCLRCPRVDMPYTQAILINTSVCPSIQCCAADQATGVGSVTAARHGSLPS